MRTVSNTNGKDVDPDSHAKYSFLLKGIVRWDFSTHYSRRGRFREENAFYRIKNGHIFPEISATNDSILPCLKKTVGLSKDGQLASTGIILQ